MTNDRSFDIAIWGATSYTAKHAIEYLFKTYGPSGKHVRYVLAGRNLDKIRDVMASLGLPDDTPIREVTNDKVRLEALCRESKTLVSFVGPYFNLGKVCAEACVSQGTNYVDISGEPNWVNWLQVNLGQAARENGVLVLPCMGFDYVPMEMSSGAVFNIAKTDERDSKLTIHFNSNTAGISSGTMRTIVTGIAKKLEPAPYMATAMQTIRPIRHTNDGYIMFHFMTRGITSYMAWVNELLLKKQYDAKNGDRLDVTAGTRATSFLHGLKSAISICLTLLFVFFLVCLPESFREYFLPQIGEGPPQSASDFMWCEASLGNLKVKFDYPVGECYQFTGMSCIEAAMAINDSKYEKIENTLLGAPKMMSGISSGSVALGQFFEERLRKAGAVLEKKMIK